MLTELQKEECVKNLKKALSESSPFDSMVIEIKKWIPHGMDKNLAMDLLKSIYENASQEERDLIADVGDLVWGYCSPSKDIFPDEKGD